MVNLSTLFPLQPISSTLNSDIDVSANSWVLDEDELTSNSDTKLATQQSLKTYIDGKTITVDGGVI